MPYRIAGIDVQSAGFDFRWLPRLLHDFVGRHIGAKNHAKAFLYRGKPIGLLFRPGRRMLNVGG